MEQSLLEAFPRAGTSQHPGRNWSTERAQSPAWEDPPHQISDGLKRLMRDHAGNGRREAVGRTSRGHCLLECHTQRDSSSRTGTVPPVPPQSHWVSQSATSTGGEDKGKWPRKGWDVGKQGQAKGTHILDLRKNVLALGLNRVSTPPSGRDGAGFTALTEQTSVEGTGPDLTGSWDWLFFSCA